MKKYIRLLILLLVACVLSQYTAITPVSAATNLITGGTFEQIAFGTSASVWTPASASFVPTAIKRFGKYGLRVLDRTQNWSSVQQWVSIKDGLSYTASVWVRLAEGSDKVSIVVDSYSNGVKTQPVFAEATVGTEWVNIKGTYKMNIGSTIDRAKIYIRTETSLVDVYMDNFELWEGATIPSPTVTTQPEVVTNQPSVNPELLNTALPDIYKINMLSNGNFESGISGWSGKDATIETTREKINGTYGCRVSDVSASGGGIRRWADVSNGKTYIINAWIKSDENSTIKAVADLVTGSATTTVELASVSAKVGEWTQLYGIATIKDAGEINGAYISFIGDKSNFCIDGAELYEVYGKLAAVAKDPASFVKAIAQNGTGTNIVKNSEFEKDTSDWSISESTIAVSTAEKHNGNSSCLVSNRTQVWGSAQQYIPIEANKTYTISAWVKLTGESDTINLYLDYWEGETKKGMTIDSKVSIDGWVNLKGDVKLLNVTKAKLYVSTAKSKSNYYIDDVVAYNGAAITTASNEPSYLVKGSTLVTLKNSNWNDLYNWDFSTFPHSAYSLAGWMIENASIKVSDKDGKTGLEFLTEDPNIITPRDVFLNIDAQKSKYIRIRMKNNSKAGKAELYWGTDASRSFSSERKVSFEISKNATEFTEYILDMSKHPEWKGNITMLKFDPVTEVFLEDESVVGNTIIDYIKVSNTNGGFAFTDTLGHWANSDITKLIKNNAVERDSTNFMPDQSVTRAEFVDMLMRTLNMVSAKIKTSSMSDVTSDKYWYKSVLAAEDAGIVLGADSKFNPDYTITREEISTMLIRACNYFERRNEWQFTATPFNDDADISDWAQKFVYIATSIHLMNGLQNNYFAPKANATKGESAALVSRTADWINARNDSELFVSNSSAFNYDIVRLSVKDPKNGQYQNPFNPDEVAVEAVFTSSTGKQLIVPAYFDLYDDYTFDPRRSATNMSPKAYWKIRFSPNEAGTWNCSVKIKDQDGERVLATSTITSFDAVRDGFVRVDPQNARFVFDNGKPFFGIGTNLCWPDGANGNSGSGPVSYEDYYKDFVDNNGGNFIRIWFEEYSSGMENRYTGPGVFDNKYASRMDYIMLLSKQKGVKVMPSIRTFHFLETSRWWLNGSHTNFNGGFLDIPKDVFSNQQSIKTYKDMLRFLVARYGAYDNLVGWQFWNEENGISGYKTVKPAVSTWYDTMHDYVASIDAYDHLIGTSFSDISGEQMIYGKSSTQFTTAHAYGIGFWAEIIRGNSATKQVKYPKIPQYNEEQGLKTQDNALDKTGVNLHNALWASLTTGDTATSMPWWWDSYVKPNNLFSLYGPIKKMVTGLVWPDANSKLIDLQTESSLKGNYLVPAGYDNNNTAGLDPYKSFNLNFVTGALRKPEEYIYPAIMEANNSYEFNVNLKESSEVIVTFMGNTYAPAMGGKIGIKIDDNSVVTVEANAGSKVADEFRVPVTAGIHKIIVSNPSTARWPIAGVAFKNTVPLVEAVGAMGDNNGVFWVRDREHSWTKVINGYIAPEISDAKVSLSGIAVGEYKLIWLDTYSGLEISTQDVTITATSAPKISVPAFKNDIAFKIIRK